MTETFIHTKKGKLKESEIDLDKFGIVLVDMQSRFLEDIAVEELGNLFISQADVLRACAEKDYPVAVLEYTGSGSTDERLKTLVKEVPRYAFFQRSRDNGFPKLKQQLNEWDLDYLCFMGISAPYCVKATASKAIKNGKLISFRNRKKILTARQLISAQTYNQRQLERAINWFERKGMYNPDYTSITNLMYKK